MYDIVTRIEYRAASPIPYHGVSITLEHFPQPCREVSARKDTSACPRNCCPSLLHDRLQHAMSRSCQFGKRKTFPGCFRAVRRSWGGHSHVVVSDAVRSTYRLVQTGGRLLEGFREGTRGACMVHTSGEIKETLGTQVHNTRLQIQCLTEAQSPLR